MSGLVIRGEPSRLGCTSDLSTGDLYAKVGGNTGNLAFSYAAALLLGFPRNLPPTFPICDGETGSLFTMANYLGEHYAPELLTEFLVSAPRGWFAVGLGLGAQGPLHLYDPDPMTVQLNEPHHKWIEAFCARAPSSSPCLGVRGGFTLEVLRRMGFGDRAVVTGCPSLMISSDKRLGERIGKKFRGLSASEAVIDTSLGNPWDPNHKAFERTLLLLSRASGGVTHVQMQLEHARLARGDRLSFEETDALHGELAPWISRNSFPAFARSQFRVWWDAPAWMESLSRADFVVGSRIHGVVLALQAGTPAICATWDSRTLELCRTMGIPHISIYSDPWGSGLFGWRDLHREFDIQFDPVRFDENRLRLAKVLNNFLLGNSIAPSGHLLALLDSQ